VTAPTTVVTYLPKKALEALIALGTPTVMLATATFTPTQDTLDFVNDVTNEASGTSYSAGGIVLTTPVVNIDTATNTLTFDAADITTAALSVSCRWAVIYVNTGTPSTSPVIAYVDLSQGVGGNVTVTGINWDAAGIVPFVVA
jgi:hypothetical protein